MKLTEYPGAVFIAAILAHDMSCQVRGAGQIP